MNLVDYIPIGSENAITRKELCILTGLGDRKVRDEIANLRREYVIINLQDGSGYFLPGPDDEKLVKRYLAQEENRAKSIFWTLKATRAYLKGEKNGCEVD